MNAPQTITLGQQLYDRQLQYLLANDADGLIDANYHPDAELVNLVSETPFVIQGQENLKSYFEGYLKQLDGLDVKSTEKFIETDKVVAFQATVETGAYGEVHVYDNFFLRDGKIYSHVTGLMGMAG